MKYGRALTLAALALMLAAAITACAKPPQAEIDAAKAAVAEAAKNSDVISYAPETLRRAQAALTQMQTELESRRYDQAKTAALEASAAAQRAFDDAKANKERSKSQAAAALEAVKTAVAETEKTIAAAKKAGVRVDFKALGEELEAAKGIAAKASADFASGNYIAANEGAAQAQSRLADIRKEVADAVQASKRKK